LIYYSKTLFSLINYYDNQKESYSIALMVVFFIKYQIIQINIQIVNNTEYLEELFISLLQYYNNFTEEFSFVLIGNEDIIENGDFLELKQSKKS
jgi:hypothetical protein